jgi:hypothetical protein
MNKQGLVTIAFSAVLGQLGCSRVNINLDKPKPADTISASSPAEAASASQPVPTIPLAPIHQSPAERIAEIDRLLSAPFSGTPEDSDRRAGLRAERAVLTESYPSAGVRSQSVVAGPRGSTASQEANQDIVNYGPATPPQNTHIIVAPDSQGDHDPHHMSQLEAMTPTERARYYRYLRLTNPNPIVPVYDGRR